MWVETSFLSRGLHSIPFPGR